MDHAPVPLARFTESPDDDQLRAAMRSVLDRIDEVDGRVEALLPEPGRRTRVLAELETLIARYPDTGSRPPLFGVPVGVKDIFRADGFETRAGSRLPSDVFVGREAAGVTRLREAGAIVIGKTVTTEFAYFQPGPTRNPWNLEHTPGGSSSGSAAAVSAGLCPVALGTQTIGSINRPASFCGVVGFKPSFGRVPRDGVIPFSDAADHVGLLAADVASARAAASILWNGWRPEAARHQEHEPTAQPPQRDAAGRWPRDRAPTVLVLDDAFTHQAGDEIRDAVMKAAERLQATGLVVRRVALFDEIDPLNEVHNRMVAREFADVHHDWVELHRERYSERSLALIEKGLKVSDAELEEARAGRLALRARIERILESEHADLVLSPSATGAAPSGIDATGSPLLNLPFTYAGLPTVTLPSTTNLSGLPLGLQIAARFGADEELIAHAASFERDLASGTPRA